MAKVPQKSFLEKSWSINATFFVGLLTLLCMLRIFYFDQLFWVGAFIVLCYANLLSGSLILSLRFGLKEIHIKRGSLKQMLVNTQTLVSSWGKYKLENLLQCWKKWFWPANSMRSTHLLVKIHNACPFFFMFVSINRTGLGKLPVLN